MNPSASTARRARPATLGLAASLVALGASAHAEPSRPREEHPIEHRIGWDRMGVWSGYRLNEHRVVAVHISDSMRWPGQGDGYGELMEMEVEGPGRRWEVRCGYTYGLSARFSIVCDFTPADGGEPALFVLPGDLAGVIITASGEPLAEVDGSVFNLQALELDFRRPAQGALARWAWRGIAPGHPLALRTSAPHEPAHDLATLAVLATLPISSDFAMPSVGARHGNNRLDSYPVQSGAPRADGAFGGALAALEARGAAEAVALVRRHLADPRRIDRPGGSYLARHPATPRLSGGLQGGFIFPPSPGGAPGPLAGGSLEAIGGVRIDRLVLSMAMGIHLGVVDEARFAQHLDAPGISSAAFGFGLQARYVVPLLAGLEGVGGASVGGRLRIIDVGGWSDTDGASQLGLALGPLQGLQYPGWEMNHPGSRQLNAVDALHEWTLWRAASVTAPAGEGANAARLEQGLSGTDRAVRVQLGIRFEL